MLSSTDILALTNDPVMKEACAATVEELGLGSCSPRGFYGTFPPHMDVERTIDLIHQLQAANGAGAANWPSTDAEVPIAVRRCEGCSKRRSRPRPWRAGSYCLPPLLVFSSSVAT